MTARGTWAQGLDLGELLPLAQRLVRIPSENPPGATGDVCRVVAQELENVGFTSELVEEREGFVNLVSTYEFSRPGKTLLLNGHVDVVPIGDSAADWTHDPWAAQVDDGRLYGRGSLDMKGPLAGLVVAARHAVLSDLPLAGKLLVAAVADEEQGGRFGTGALVKAGKLRADAALIAEPGDGGVVAAHRGMCFVELTTRGRSTHASIPEQGVNAVESMVDVLHACRSLRLTHARHPLLGSAGFAVGTTISGGQKVNVIPDRCRATLDVRSVPGMTEESVVGDLRAHFEQALPEHERPEIEILVWGEAGETKPDSAIVRLATAAYEHEFGRPAPVRGMPAATDGWWLTNRAGIPAVMGLAPGGIADCHVVDESIDVLELERYTRIYANVVASFLSVDADVEHDT